MLATDLVRVLGGHDVHAPTRAELDITDEAQVTEGGEPGRRGGRTAPPGRPSTTRRRHEEEAMRINAPVLLAKTAGRRAHPPLDRLRLLRRGRRPLAGRRADGPVNAYGRTKLAGEQVVLGNGGTVVRTAWLYGAHGPNFVRTMTRLEQSHEVGERGRRPARPAHLDPRPGPPDRRPGRLGRPGSSTPPTPGPPRGTAWRQEVFRLLGADPDRVRPITSAEFPARRPARRTASWPTERWGSAGLKPMRDWREALHDAWSTELSRPGPR